MRWADLARKLLSLAEVIHRWIDALADIEPERRQRIAEYAEAIADTLARAADALSAIQSGGPAPTVAAARRSASRELGRIHGYIATMVDVLEHRLDGRRLAGVKRRLESLDRGALSGLARQRPDINRLRIDDLYAAEGYFRALSDGLRV
ncbi:MAG: hypothetical protein APF80_07435 [Alphaproteobacteria bacterium BRH_c36]|nr:MAG: hypothetical protein APF80_07435 [Alphaproteobacteria bacterium BRH_c36]